MTKTTSFERVWHPREWKYALVVYFVMFLLIWGWMWVVGQVYAVTMSPDPISHPYMGVARETNSWLEVWQRWDTLQYQAIAERGYQAFDSALFVPPLYPLLMRGVAALVGNNTLLGGFIVSNIFCLAGLMAFQRLVVHEFGSLAAGRRAVLYMVSFPTAFFLFAAYTESLFFLGAVLCLWYLRQEKWLAAGIWGAVAALSRLPGVLIAIPAVFVVWRNWRKTRGWFPWITPILISGAAAILPLYAWLGLGLSPLAPVATQSSRFHGGLTWPGLSLLAAIKQIWLGIYPITNFFDLFFTVLFIAGTIAVWKRMPRLYGVYCLSFMGLYVVRIAAVYPLLSMARYVLALLPVFMLAAQWGKNPWVNRAILYTSWIGLLFLSGQFAVWGWVG
ncbi:MAG: hypothetical protein GXP40_12100 [Chloroflexi bacterium]|nr:hypothetical protein [Chloroflexota bacterium]